MGFKTVYEGERAILIDKNGSVTTIDGPKRTFLILSKLEKLTRYVADFNEYLVVEYVSGRVEHKPGPVSVWFNRFEHNIIKLKSCYQLDESQLIVVYSREPEDNKVTRRTVKGPLSYMPQSNEWLHQFSWHGPAQDSQEGHLVPNVNKFEILKTKPDFFNYNIREVRTIDDTLINVRIMLIYELVDVELMLDKTQDPISDFINAICADVVGFVSKLTFTEFLECSATRLNDLKTYEQLTQRASRTGFKIVSILYNGYISSPALQEMQEAAIYARTQLRIQLEIDKQQNELTNVRLESQRQRLKLESELEKKKTEFAQKTAQLGAEFDMEKKRLEHELQVACVKSQAESSKEIQSASNQSESEFLKSLSQLSVDVNKFTCESNKAKNRVDKSYQIVNLN